MHTIMTGWQLFILVGGLVAAGWLLRMLYQWEVIEKRSKDADIQGQDTPPGL